MAANYLQTLNWRSEPEIMKQIVTFYTKAKAPASLALFYEACSQVEIDEYQNYEKALGALREAQRHMVKARAGDRDPRLVALTSRIQNIERFLQARKLAASSPSSAEEAASTFRQLLDTPDINFSVRVGDIIAALVAYHYSQGSRVALNEAFMLIDRMVKSRLDVFFYLDEALVKDIYTRLGLPFEFVPPANSGDAAHGIEEDIRED
jgi:intraflagellar transport protein 140